MSIIPIISPTTSISYSNTSNALQGGSGVTWTFLSQSFGSADVGRYIAISIGAGWSDTGGRVISSVTIGGVTATQAAIKYFFSSGRWQMAAIYIAAVPTGTSGTVVVAFNAGVYACAISVERIVGISSATPSSTSTDSDAAGGGIDLSLNIPGDGFAMAVVAIDWLFSTAVTTSWSGMTEAYDNSSAGGYVSFSMAYFSAIQPETARAISASFAGGTPIITAGCACAWAAIS